VELASEDKRTAAAAASVSGKAVTPSTGAAFESTTVELIPCPKGLPENDFESKTQCQKVLASISERLSGDDFVKACGCDASTSPELAAMVLSTLSTLLKDPVIEGLVTKAVVNKVNEGRSQKAYN
jgi:hypothetical protein